MCTLCFGDMSFNTELEYCECINKKTFNENTNECKCLTN